MSKPRPLCAEMIILSAYKKERSPRENDVAHRQLSFILSRYGYTNQMPVLGRFCKQNEESIAIFSSLNSEFSTRQIEEVATIAEMFQQELILLETGGIGRLYSVADEQTHLLGPRRTYAEAPKEGDWTFLNGKYIQFK
jgi:hypothetical protein